eukprot:TRINITY_DN120952_c0_g1_i1.p1 TRINITY_DN120952_c0_g1~~TRINITY_DN120952_c0_g1_i1.p1  ORF type:complete len:203 (+),score=56.72 TRINITY_DN120952_c0_g1_i1:126-734(+)
MRSFHSDAMQRVSLKNTFIDTFLEEVDTREDALDRSTPAKHRSRSVPAPHTPDCGAAPAPFDIIPPMSPQSGRSTACSENGADSEAEDSVRLPDLPEEVRGSVKEAIKVVRGLSFLNIEGESVKLDDADEDDRIVRVTFTTPGFKDEDMKAVKLVFVKLFADELGGYDKLEVHDNHILRLIMGGPFRFTWVDLTFVSAAASA